MPGSYRKRGNAYLLAVCIGTDYKGKPQRFAKTIHVKTDKEADKALALFYAECEAGAAPKPSTLTIKELCESYLKENAPYAVKKSTLDSMKSTFTIHVIPDLGKVKATQLTRGSVQRWVNDLRQKLSPKTVRNCVSNLSSVFVWAQMMEMVTDNPCRGVSLPSGRRTEANYLSKSEVALLLERLEMLPERELKYKIAIYIALFGGLRKSEIVGLDWKHFDAVHHTLRIEQTRMIGRSIGVYSDSTKTEKSVRTISIPVELSYMLSNLKAQQERTAEILGPEWTDSPAIIKGDFGRPIYPQVLTRWFTRFQAQQGLRPVGLHGLRHTHTSMLAYLNLDKMLISKRLGHSQLSTTLNIYTHLFDEVDNTAAQLSSVFLPQREQAPRPVGLQN